MSRFLTLPPEIRQHVLHFMNAVPQELDVHTGHWPTQSGVLLSTCRDIRADFITLLRVSYTHCPPTYAVSSPKSISRLEDIERKVCAVVPEARMSILRLRIFGLHPHIHHWYSILVSGPDVVWSGLDYWEISFEQMSMNIDQVILDLTPLPCTERRHFPDLVPRQLMGLLVRLKLARQIDKCAELANCIHKRLNTGSDSKGGSGEHRPKAIMFGGFFDIKSMNDVNRIMERAKQDPQGATIRPSGDIVWYDGKHPDPSLDLKGLLAGNKYIGSFENQSQQPAGHTELAAIDLSGLGPFHWSVESGTVYYRVALASRDTALKILAKLLRYASTVSRCRELWDPEVLRQSSFDFLPAEPLQRQLVRLLCQDLKLGIQEYQSSLGYIFTRVFAVSRVDKTTETHIPDGEFTRSLEDELEQLSSGCENAREAQ